MRTRSLFIAAIAAASVLASCGSDTTTAKPADTTTGNSAGSATTAGGATGSTTPNTAPGAGSEFCKLNDALSSAPSPFANQNAVAADFEKFFNEVIKPGVAGLQAAAPSEIKADMDTLAEGYNALADRFAALGYDPTKASTDTLLVQIGNEQKYNDASAALNTYCGVGG
jgi:hypothetical protein